MMNVADRGASIAATRAPRYFPRPREAFDLPASAATFLRSFFTSFRASFTCSSNSVPPRRSARATRPARRARFLFFFVLRFPRRLFIASGKPRQFPQPLHLGPRRHRAVLLHHRAHL